MIKEHLLEARSDIFEIIITVGTAVLSIRGSQIGLFEMGSISKLMSKQGITGTCYRADAMLIEVYHDCVGEIEVLLKELRSTRGLGVRSVKVDYCGSTDMEEYDVFYAYSVFHYYRVNSDGDIRIIIGDTSKLKLISMWDAYECSPSGYFDFYGEYSFDLFNGKRAICPEVEAKNYYKRIFKQMRDVAKIMVAVVNISGMNQYKTEARVNSRLVLYLSILDELHKARGTKRLNISQYTFYDEEEKCYTNMRIQYILNDYHNINWKDTEELDDIRLLCKMFDGYSVPYLSRLLFALCFNNSDTDASMVIETYKIEMDKLSLAEIFKEEGTIKER